MWSILAKSLLMDFLLTSIGLSHGDYPRHVAAAWRVGIREIQAMPGEVAAILRFVPFAGSGQPYARNPFEVPAVSGQQRAAVGGHDAGNQAVGHPDGTT